MSDNNQTHLLKGTIENHTANSLIVFIKRYTYKNVGDPLGGPKKELISHYQFSMGLKNCFLREAL